MQGIVFQWLLDITVVVIILSCIGLGMKRGLVVSVLRIVSFLVSAIVAFAISGPVATWLYDTLFRGAVESNSVSSIYGFIIKSLVDPAVVVLIRVVIFLILMIVLSLLIKALLNTLKVINKIPVIGQLNALLGGAVGLLNALLWLFVVAMIVSGYNMLVPQNTFINESVIDSTYLFKFVARINPFKLG